MTTGAEQFFTSEAAIPANSLARPENWPGWAVELTEGEVGLSALRRIALTCNNVCFLGMPSLVESIEPRESFETSNQGELVEQRWGTKVSLVVAQPEAAILRALINRKRLEGLPDLDDRCWSGWLFFRFSKPELQPLTTQDMWGESAKCPKIGFVAVFSGKTIRSNGGSHNLDTPFADKPLAEDRPCEAVIYPHGSLVPDLIVPVTHDRDFPGNTVLLRGSPGRRIAARAWLGGLGIPREGRQSISYASVDGSLFGYAALAPSPYYPSGSDRTAIREYDGYRRGC